MTLIESLLLAVIHGLSRFIPIAGDAHERILEQLLGWPTTDLLWKSSFALGSLLALLVFFIHDWASILSSFIQVIVARKRPMTFDERFPFFLIFFSVLPGGGYWYLKEQQGIDPENLLPSHSNLILAAGLFAGAILLLIGERWSKKTRGLFDIDLMDSTVFGAGQCLAALPGITGSLGMSVMSLLRNYHLEAATKLIALFSLPMISFEAGRMLSALDWSARTPFGETTWLQWALSVLVAGAATFVSLRVFTDQIRKSGFGRWVAYRILLGTGLIVLHFL